MVCIEVVHTIIWYFVLHSIEVYRMKFFWIGSAYELAIDNVMKELTTEQINQMDYVELRDYVLASNIDYFGKNWCEALSALGYETEYSLFQSDILLKKWCNEHEKDVSYADREDIIFTQIKRYQADIVYVDDCVSVDLCKKIKHEIKSVKMIIAWAGSAMALSESHAELYKFVDLVMCCAPEGVAYLKQQGANALHMNHAFFSNYTPLEQTTNIQKVATFIGSIYRGKNYHFKREDILIKVKNEFPVNIYSPSVEFLTPKYIVKFFLKFSMHECLQYLPFQLKNGVFQKYKSLESINEYKPIFPVSSGFIRHLRKPVFGNDMLNTLCKSYVVLNIHADSSPIYASNMRLFESTGVGTCLLTDYKKNIEDLFEPGKEILTYKTVDECIEKMKYIRDHPNIRDSIAAAGYKRCMKDHNYNVRAEKLAEYIRKKHSCVQTTL